MTRRIAAGPLLILLAACAKAPSVPSEPAPASVATFVSAVYDLTWTAALDHVATLGVRTASVDRRAGVIVTEESSVDPAFALEFADCGARGAGDGSARFRAARAVYEVRVSRDGSASTVLVTATWTTEDPDAPFDCTTTRVWEDEAQEAIRLAAEVNR